ncbi:MAG: hypothetical protein MJ092_03530 [Lachnospiraceae bacterium]|nr:hypothetical protein [Lachnospiraceae bacterium]
MKKIVLAVFDCSWEYIDKFSDYIKRKKSLPFEILGFSNREALWNYVESNKIHVLLFSQEELVDDEKSGEEICEQFVSHTNVGKFIYLGKQRKNKSTLRYINKYQSMETIIKELLNVMEVDPPEETPQSYTMIGIYSVVPEEKTFQATLSLVSNLAMGSSILYLSFDRFSILDPEQNGNSSISDLIYFFKTNPKQIKEELKKTVGRYRGFDFLTAPLEQSDIDELNYAEWKDFFSRLATEGNYEQIVIDMYEAFKNLEEIFHCCEKVYVPIAGNEYALKKARMKKMHLFERGRQDLVEKLVMMNLEG